MPFQGLSVRLSFWTEQVVCELVVGTQMGGCGFQEKCHLHPALDCEAENWAGKNRSFAKANSDALGIGEITSALEDEDDL
jgi:hypothetical protein